MAQSLPPRSDGLVLRLGETGATSQSLAEQAQRIVVEAKLPGSWSIRPLGRQSRDFAIRRPAGQKNPTVAQAFDFAYRLRKHREVEDCEPSLLFSLEGPRELRPRPAVAVAKKASSTSSGSSTGGGTHLSCSTSPTWIHSDCSIAAAWSLPLPPGGKSQGEGILVGHPDTGFTDHPQLNEPGRLLTNRGFDFDGQDPDARDDLSGFSGGHGTATGSVIMSSADPDITGVAPRCQLIPLRVTSSVVLASFGTLAEAIQFAADEGHHVLSISLGGPLYSRFLHRAIEAAVNRGIIVVCAAGNVWPFVVYPARLDEVVAAAASNCQRAIWSDSASGATVDITAPGESVWRALAAPGGFSSGRSSGTSFSTAIVAGAAALWLAHHGRHNLIQRYGPAGLVRVFKELLLTRGFDRRPGWDTSKHGVGILNAEKLLSAPLPATVHAAGVHALRATPGPRSRNQVDELLDLFPDEEPSRVRSGLARLLNVPERELNTALRDVGEEIAYLAVTDLEFRSELCRTGRAKPPRRMTAATRTRSRAASVAALPAMSRQLKKLCTPASG